MIAPARWRAGATDLIGQLNRHSGFAGVLWSSLNAGAGVLLPFLVFVFFAHVLVPAQIGMVVLAVSCAEFVKAMGFPGLYEALLQRTEQRQRYHETTLAVLLISGVTLLAAYVGAIVLLARLVDGVATNQLALLAVGLRVPLDLATLQPQAALAQRLSYRRMAIRAIFANAGGGAIGIVLALSSAPLAGLVAYQVGQSALLFATTVVGTGALARPRLHRDCVRRMAHEATMSSIVRLVAATNNYVDQILIAAILNSTRLAYFNLAKRVETTFITAGAAYSAILFQPLFVKRDGAGRESVLRKGLAMLTLLCGLPVVFLTVNASRLVPLIFGDRWSVAAPVVALLAIGGLARTLGSTHGALLSVSGRNRQLAVISTVSAISGILAVVATAHDGIVWCAAALMAKNVLVLLWLAAATRLDVPRTAQAYLTDVVVPLAMMLLGAIAGRLLAGIAVPGSAPTATIVVMSASVLAGGLCGLTCLAGRFVRPVPLSVPVRG